MDRSRQGAPGGCGRPRPSPHTGERVLVQPGRRRRRELPLRDHPHGGVLGRGPRPAAGVRVVRRRAAGPPDPRPERRAARTGTSTTPAGTSRRWRSRTSMSATCGHSSRACADQSLPGERVDVLVPWAVKRTQDPARDGVDEDPVESPAARFVPRHHADLPEVTVRVVPGDLGTSVRDGLRLGGSR